MPISHERCIGYIQLQFIDEKNNQIVSLGGAGFNTQNDLQAAWIDIPRFEGHTAFMAELLNADHDTLDDKPICAEACESLLKRPISELIEEGRTELRAYLASLEAKLAR